MKAAITVRARCVGRYDNAFDALLAMLATHDALGDGQRGDAAPAERLKGLSAIEIQELLVTLGFKVTPDFASRLRLDAIHRFDHGVSAALDLNEEQSPGRIHDEDGADAHAASVGRQGGAA